MTLVATQGSVTDRIHEFVLVSSQNQQQPPEENALARATCVH